MVIEGKNWLARWRDCMKDGSTENNYKCFISGEALGMNFKIALANSIRVPVHPRFASKNHWEK